jgi:hypothetical protein
MHAEDLKGQAAELHRHAKAVREIMTERETTKQDS